MSVGLNRAHSVEILLFCFLGVRVVTEIVQNGAMRFSATVLFSLCNAVIVAPAAAATFTDITADSGIKALRVLGPHGQTAFHARQAAILLSHRELKAGRQSPPQEAKRSFLAAYDGALPQR